MRARRQHGHAPATYPGGEETLVQNQRVDLGLVAPDPPGVVSGQAGLVAGDPFDLTAADEQVRDEVDVGAAPYVAAGGLELLERGLGRQQREIPGGCLHPPLVGTVGMQIDDRCRATGSAAGLGDRGHDRGKASRVIGVPVRQEDPLDLGEVKTDALRVVEPHVGIGADVEQRHSLVVARSAANQYREPVAGNTEVVEHAGPDVAVVGHPRRRKSLQQ